MSEISCPSCGKKSSFNDNNAPRECPYCFEEIGPARATGEAPAAGEEVARLTLIYQINQQRIELPVAQRTVLGREEFGASVLSRIFYNGKAVVSRKHCSIEFRENKFYLRDEGSLNGTYYGVNKLDCRTAPQAIENGALVYMGEEPFLAQIRFKAPERVEQEAPVTAEDAAVAPSKYRCNDPNCLLEFDRLHPYCPSCGTYNTLIPIHE